jgi:hypothetical protein
MQHDAQLRKFPTIAASSASPSRKYSAATLISFGVDALDIRYDG